MLQYNSRTQLTAGGCCGGGGGVVSVMAAVAVVTVGTCLRSPRSSCALLPAMVVRTICCGTALRSVVTTLFNVDDDVDVIVVVVVTACEELPTIRLPPIPLPALTPPTATELTPDDLEGCGRSMRTLLDDAPPPRGRRVRLCRLECRGGPVMSRVLVLVDTS